eukprot:s2819_g5.t1
MTVISTTHRKDLAFTAHRQTQKIYRYRSKRMETVASLLLFADQLAAAAAAWSDDEKDRLEACRECCRTICTQIGLTPATVCMANLWVCITMSQVKLQGFTGEDIDVTSMGTFKEASSLESIKDLNVYHMAAFKRELTIMMEMMTGLQEILNPDWMLQVRTLCDEISTKVS